MSTNTSPITLSPHDKNVTITGIVDAYGAVGTYSLYGNPQAILYTAVFGPKSTHFTVHNTGSILSHGTAATDFGIVLDSSSTIKNTGLIEAQSGILIAGPSAAVIDNSGEIIANNVLGSAIYLTGGGVVTNALNGTVQSAGVAISLKKSGTLINAGKIISHNAPGGGNPIFYGAVSAATVTNAKSGTITDTSGIGVSAAAVYNYGGITAATGIVLLTGGYAYNAAGATIIATTGIESSTLTGQSATYALIYNYGVVLGSSIGVAINGGTLINAGTILGGVIAQSATIIDTGNITGTNGTALTFKSGKLADRLIIDAAATFTGTVKLNGALLEIAADGTTGISIAASEFIGIGALNIDSKATVELAGAYTTGHILNHGDIIEAANDTLTITSSLTNAGTVETTPNETAHNGFGPFMGIVLTGAASVDNSGLLLGGLYASAGSAIITNAGTILNESQPDRTNDGIYLAEGGNIDNTGKITGDGFGVYMKDGGTLVNAGLISSGSDLAVVADHAVIHNDKSGLIRNRIESVSISEESTLFNAGTISGRLGVDVSRGSTLVNTGTILGSSSLYGSVYIQYGGTLIDTGGLIEGAIEFQKQYPVYSDRFVINAHATFQGAQLDGNATLEIAPVANAIDTIKLGTQVFNIGALTVDSGATLEIAGTYGANFGFGFIPSFGVTNTGLMLESVGVSLSLDGTLTGAGTFDLAAGDVLALNGGVGPGQTISFTSVAETIALGRPGAFAGTIADFQPGDTIDLTGINLTHIKSEHFANGVLTLTATTTTYRYAIAGDFGNETFSLFADSTGTGITLSSSNMKILSPDVTSSAILTNLITPHASTLNPVNPPLPTAAIPGVLTYQPLPPTFFPTVTLHF